MESYKKSGYFKIIIFKNRKIWKEMEFPTEKERDVYYEEVCQM